MMLDLMKVFDGYVRNYHTLNLTLAHDKHSFSMTEIEYFARDIVKTKSRDSMLEEVYEVDGKLKKSNKYSARPAQLYRFREGRGEGVNLSGV